MCRWISRFLAVLTAGVVILSGVHGNRSAPEIIEPPGNIVAQEGEEVELRCQAIGEPPPRVHWRKDNHLLKWSNLCEEERKCIREDGTLVIKEAIIEDSGRYRCRVRNHVGRVESETVYVAVEHKYPQPPQFLNGGPDDVTIRSDMIGGTVVVKCEAVGKGHLVFTWSKEFGDKKLPEDRAYQNEDNSLVIEQFQSSDAGSYACTVGNKHGWTSKMISLYVAAEHKHVPPQDGPLTDPPLLFLVFPEDQTVYVGDTVMFDCKIQGPFDTSLVWYYGVMKSDGTVTREQNIGSPPDINSENLMISDKRFDIFVNGTLSISNVTIKDNKRTFVCEGYSSEGVINYPATLSVLAPPTKKPTRAGDGSDPSELPTTPALPAVPIDGKPDKVPVVSTATPQSSTVIRLTWTYPDLLSSRRPTGYYISYDFADNPKGEKTQTVNGGRVLSHDVVGLKPYTAYDIRVFPFNDVGQGLASNFVLARTLEGAPSRSPSDVQIIVQDDKGTVLVKWTPVPEADQNGGLSGYKIVYSCGNSRGTKIDVHPEESSKEIRLKPGDNCTVSVSAYNSKGEVPSPTQAFLVESSTSESFTTSTYFIIIVTFVAITVIFLIIMVVVCVMHRRRSDIMVVNKDLGHRPDPAGARTSVADMEEMVFHDGENMSSTPTSRTPRGYFPAPPSRPAPTPTLVASTSMQQAMNSSIPVTTELYFDTKGSSAQLEYAYASEGPHLEDNAPPIPNRRPAFRPGYRKGSIDLAEGMMAYATDGHIDEAGFDLNANDATRRSIRSYELEYGKSSITCRKTTSGCGRDRDIPSKMNNSTLASRNLDVRPIGRQSEL